MIYCTSVWVKILWSVIYCVARVAGRNDYRLGGLNNGNVLPHSSQDWKLELQGKVGLSLPCILRFRWPLKPAGVDQNRGNLCLHLHTPSSLCTSACPFLSKDTCIGFRVHFHLILILTLITSAKILFLNKVTFWASGWMWTFWGDTNTPTTFMLFHIWFTALLLYIELNRNQMIKKWFMTIWLKTS